MSHFFPHKIILHHIKLIQLENFDLSRFFMAVRNRFISRPGRHIEVIWTAKLSLVTGLAVILQALAAFGISLLFSSFQFLFALLFVVLLSFLFFVFLSAATLIVRPVDRLIRFLIISRARKKLAKLSDISIIGITGSYGKTTMKNTVFNLLSEELTVVKTGENKNTPLGISRTILSDLTKETDVFVVEMGAYERGDIKELCELATPDISILTGINEAHLKRFGSIENTIIGKFEIVEHAKEDAAVIANADDGRVLEHAEDFIKPNQTLTFFSARNNKHSSYRAIEKEFHQDGSGISFELMRGSENIGYFKVPHLADYIIGNIVAAFLTAEALGLSIERVRSGVSKLTPASHRLEKVSSKRGIIVIDDSYNGNPDGVEAAINVLDKFKDKRKVFVTPGLVEMGDRKEQVHRNIGKRLGDVADQVVLIDTSVTPFIVDGLKEVGFEKGNIIHVDSIEEARMFLSGTVEEGDVILFQNDWPENYV